MQVSVPSLTDIVPALMGAQHGKRLSAYRKQQLRDSL
jgi:hypothetical protein